MQKTLVYIYRLVVADYEINQHITLQHKEEYTDEQFFGFVAEAFSASANLQTAQHLEDINNMRGNDTTPTGVALKNSNKLIYSAARLYDDAVTFLISMYGFYRPIPTAAIYLDGTRCLDQPLSPDDMFLQHDHTNRLSEHILKECPNLIVKQP